MKFLTVSIALAAALTCFGSIVFADKVGNEKDLPVNTLTLEHYKLPLYDKIIQMFSQPDPINTTDPWATNWTDPGTADPKVNMGDTGAWYGVVVTRIETADQPAAGTMAVATPGDTARLSVIGFKSYNFGPVEPVEVRVAQFHLNSVKSLKDVLNFDEAIQVSGNSEVSSASGDNKCLRNDFPGALYTCQGKDVRAASDYVMYLARGDQAVSARVNGRSLVVGRYEFRRYKTAIVGILHADKNGQCDGEVSGRKFKFAKSDSICEAVYYFVNKKQY